MIKTPVVFLYDGIFAMMRGVLVTLKGFPLIAERNTVGVSFSGLINVLRLKFRFLIEIKSKAVFYSFCILPKLPLTKDQFANILLKK